MAGREVNDLPLAAQQCRQRSHAVELLDAHLHPTGTGPFNLAKWEMNQLIALEKNPDYFKKGLPYLDRIEFKIMKGIPEGTTCLAMLKKGEADFGIAMDGPVAEEVKRHPLGVCNARPVGQRRALLSSHREGYAWRRSSQFDRQPGG